MKIPRVLNDFISASDANLESQAQKIYNAMNGNANFPTPDPPLADVLTTIQNYTAALAAAQMGDKTNRAIKTNMRSALVTTLLNLASSVSSTAKGDRPMLISSGFTLNKETNSPRVLGSADNFRVELGKNSGEAILSVNGVKGAKSYIFYYTLAPSTNDRNWTNAIGSQNTYTFTGLEPLKQYCFRIAISGSNNQVVYTDVITKTIL